MNFIFYILGLLTFPLIIALIFLLINRSSKVSPQSIPSLADLQKHIGLLFKKGVNGETLFIQEQATNYLIRITKIERKVKNDTLKTEIRASSVGTELYDLTKEYLEKNSIVFKEKLTHKFKKPSRLLIKDDVGGIFTISSTTHVVKEIMNLVSDNKPELLISDKEPFFWKKQKYEPTSFAKQRQNIP